MSRAWKALTLGVLTGISGVLFLPFGFPLEENVGLNFLFKVRGPRDAPTDVVIVTIDESSANRLALPREPDKWPRSVHARLTDTLIKRGVAVIAFDIIFSEPGDPEEDALFAEAIRRARNVVLCEALEPEIRTVTGGGGRLAGAVHMESRVAPVPVLAESAAATAPWPLPRVPVQLSQYWTFKTTAGDTPTLPVVAFQLLALEVHPEFVWLLKAVEETETRVFSIDVNQLVSSSSVEELMRTLRAAFKMHPRLSERFLREWQQKKVPELEPRKRKIIESAIRMYQGPDSLYLNFYGPAGTISTVPYHAVLQEDTTPEDQERIDFAGKAVFVGLSEHLWPRQKDGFYTVFSSSDGLDLSGVELAATAFANLLEDAPVRPLGFPTSIAITALWGLALGTLCLLLPSVIGAFSALGLGLAYLTTAQYQFNSAGNWYPWITPILLQTPMAFIGAIMWKYADAKRERHAIREAFQYYIPSDVVDEMATKLVSINTSCQIVHGTCLATDAGQYTKLSERLDPRELNDFMNRYYAVIFEPVRRYGGIVSDVTGDAMMAIWTTAHPDETVRRQACLAALEIARSVNRFNESSGGLQLPTRIGVHSGYISLGNIGAMDHYEYRAVGDIVNTASRIEGLNKYLGTYKLVSEAAVHRLDDFLARDLGKYVLAGKSKSITIYEIIDQRECADDRQKRFCEIFAKAVGFYRAQAWEKAIKAFQEIIRAYGNDGPSMFYLNLCEKLRKAPPGVMWDDTIHIESK